MLQILLVTFGIAVVLQILAQYIFPRIGLLDFPERYGLQRTRIPYPTGIIAIAVFIVGFAILEDIGTQQWGVIAAVTILGIISTIDDRLQLPPSVRILTQIIVIVLIFATGSRIYTITNPLDGIGMGDIIKLDTFDIQTKLFGPLPFWSGIFTIIWLGLTMNALNWFDGIPGQVSVLSSIGFIMLALLALSERVNQPAIAALAFLLLGISLSYILFDFPPPKALMGDTGAMFFGLMLGLLGIYQGGKVATAFLVLALPLFDAMLVAISRMRKGSSPIKGDTDHLHHRLLARGYSPRMIVLSTGLLGSLFGITALFLNTFGKGIAAILLFALVALLRRWSSRSLPNDSNRIPSVG